MNYKMSDFKHNPKKVTALFREQKDDSMYLTEDCSIIIPKDWYGTRLAKLDNEFFICSILMIRSKKDYTIWNVAGTIEIGITEYQTITIDGTECLEFLYKAGEIVIKNLKSPIDNTLPYYITEIITKKGSVLPYLSYEEFLRIPETFPKYCGMRIPNYAYTNIYMAYVCRAKEDPSLRANLSKREGYVNIPLNAIHLSVENTMNAISGGNLDTAIQSKLIKPSKKASMDEIILRS